MKSILLMLALLMTGCSVVSPGSKGVRITAGQIQPGTVSSGYYLMIPFLRHTKSLSVRIQKSTIETGASSKDMQQVKAHLAINWHIDSTKVDDFYTRVGFEDDGVMNVLLPAANEVMKSATAKKTAEEILTKRAELKHEIDTGLRAWVANYSLVIDDVSLVDLDFTREFNLAVERKQIAEQEAQQANYVALKAIKEAEARVNRAKGEAEAQRLLQSSTTPTILQQKAIDKWDGKFPQVMGNGAMPFINFRMDTKE